MVNLTTVPPAGQVTARVAGRKASSHGVPLVQYTVSTAAFSPSQYATTPVGPHPGTDQEEIGVAVEFRLLGDVEARADGGPLVVGYAQLRCSLAVLLIEANRTVSVDQLVDRIWGVRHLPRRPRSAVQHNMAVLRKALAGAEDVTIAWRSVGYQITVDPEAVDVHKFRQLLGQARSADDEDRTADLFTRALALWRGEPCTGLESPWLDSVRTALTQERHAARLDLTDVQLRRGEHAALLAELAVQSRDHPLDERVAGQLMLALYRSGRQADALDHYQDMRRRLADELGADPGPSLRKLHHQILTADRRLDVPAASRPPGWPPVPRQLPAAPRPFTGRVRELAAITKSLDAQADAGATVLIAAIGGAGGIGKTWLASLRRENGRDAGGPSAGPTCWAIARGFRWRSASPPPGPPDTRKLPLSALADELRDRVSRLDALDTGEVGTSLRSVLSWSYHALPAEAGAVFGLLGLAPGPDISLSAVAALTALPVPRARLLLREMDSARLVHQHAPGRYRMHDLVRLYAADQARDDQPAAGRTAALRRLTDFYLHTAVAGDRLLYPHRDPVTVGDPGGDCRPHPLHDEAAAAAWFAAEHLNLLAIQQAAAEQAWHAPVWQLAWALDTFHRRQGNLDDSLVMWRAGQASASRLDDPAAQITAHRRLGSVYNRLGFLTDALDHLGQALVLAERTGDRLAQAHSHYFTAITRSHLGDSQRALEHATRALHLFRALDLPEREANALNQMGWHEAELGRHPQARAHCEAALALFRRFRDRDGEANTLDSLGYIAQRSGQHEQALTYFQQALVILRDLGDAYEEASTTDRMAQAHHALGQHEQARVAWEQALGIYGEQRRTDEASQVRRRLDTLPRESYWQPGG